MRRSPWILFFLTSAVCLFTGFGAVAGAGLLKDDIYAYQLSWNNVAGQSTCTIKIASLTPQIRLETKFNKGFQANNLPFYYPVKKTTVIDNAAAIGIAFFELDNAKKEKWLVSEDDDPLFGSTMKIVEEVNGKPRAEFQIAERVRVYDLVGLLFSFAMNPDNLGTDQEYFLLESKLRKNRFEIKETGSASVPVVDPVTGKPVSIKCIKLRGKHKGSHIFDLFLSKKDRIPVKLDFKNKVSVNFKYRENAEGILKKYTYDLRKETEKMVGGSGAAKVGSIAVSGQNVVVNMNKYRTYSIIKDAALRRIVYEELVFYLKRIKYPVDYNEVTGMTQKVAMKDVYYKLQVASGKKYPEVAFSKIAAKVRKQAQKRSIGGSGGEGWTFTRLEANRTKNYAIDFVYEKTKNYPVNDVINWIISTRGFKVADVEKKDRSGKKLDLTVRHKRILVE